MERRHPVSVYVWRGSFSVAGLSDPQVKSRVVGEDPVYTWTSAAVHVT